MHDGPGNNVRVLAPSGHPGTAHSRQDDPAGLTGLTSFELQESWELASLPDLLSVLLEGPSWPFPSQLHFSESLYLMSVLPITTFLTLLDGIVLLLLNINDSLNLSTV